MKDNTIFIWVLLIFLILINCSYYSPIDRIGGDITGFFDDYGTVRFYSNYNDYHFLDILEDTSIDNINYKTVTFDYNKRYFTINESWIIERITFNNNIINIPYINNILVEGNRFEKEEENLNYSYIYYMFTDSIIEIENNNTIYPNVYAIRTRININVDEKDTIIENQLLISNEYGIVGLYIDNNWFLLDSIVK